MASKILYKYGSFSGSKLEAYDVDTGLIFNKEYWKLCVLDGYLYTSNPLYFNDPYDCSLLFNTNIVLIKEVRNAIVKTLNKYCRLHKIDINRILYSKDFNKAINDVMDKHGIRNKDVSINIQDILNGLSEQLREMFCIVCLSECNDVFLMWSHYAKDHTGYCIEYTIPESEQFFEKLYPVKYITKRNSLSHENISEDQIINLVLEKAIFWEYEKEWRFVIPNKNITGNIPIDKQATRTYMEFKDYISGIYLGSKSSEEHIKIVTEEYKNTSVPIHKMKLDDYEYKLLSEKILN